MKIKTYQIFYFTIFLIPSFLWAQNSPSKIDPHQTQLPLKHCDLQAGLLTKDLAAGLSTPILSLKYPIRVMENRSYVPALVKVSEQFDRDKFRAFDVLVGANLGNIYSIQIPTENYQGFIGTAGIEYLELAKEVHPKLDKALIASKVDVVHEGTNLSQPYAGEGVVVGVIDVGFDYTHPTFSDPETGELRIKRVWEQNSPIGDPPTGYSYGKEFDNEESIRDAEFDIGLTGHGSHVAGIAAGNGATLPERYRGVAFKSDIVLVSLNVEEGNTGLNTGFIDGIKYIFDYAESVGMPAVVNISHGHHTGPHDGTSLADQAIDAMSGPGKIIVGAVGNEGDASGFYLHFDHNFDEENSILSYLVWPDDLSAGVTLIDIWGEGPSDFQVSLEIFNPSTKMREASGEVLNSSEPVSFTSGHLVDLEGDTLFYEGGIEVNPLNNRPHARFYVDNRAQKTGTGVNRDNQLDNDFVQLRFQSGEGKIHAYAANNSGEAFFTDLSGIGADEFIEGTRVQGGNERSTMGELGGTAHKIISVGGYTTKTSFITEVGDTFYVEGEIEAAYFKSSQGPTLDGRVKPDISAPANLIASAENSFNFFQDGSLIVNEIEKENGNVWEFGMRRGTSMAAPMVAGIVALMLEADPNLTPELTRDLLAASAEKDDFTGDLPNQIWGYGKVNAAGAMSSLDQPTAVDFFSRSKQIQVFPNPSRGVFEVESNARQPMEISIHNTAGALLFEQYYPVPEQQIRIDVSGIANGVYFMKMKQSNQLMQVKLVIVN